MELIDKNAVYEEMLFAMAGTGYQSRALSVIESMPVIDPPPNEPLTLEELRAMGLMEWLWVEIIQPTKGMSRLSFLGVKSAYYQIFEDYTYGEAFCCGWPGQYGVKHEFEYDNYGKNWLAYRRKPEEGER